MNLSGNVKPPKIKMTFLQCFRTGNEVGIIQTIILLLVVVVVVFTQWT